MDFRVTEEQAALMRTLRDFCKRRVGAPRDREGPLDRALFRDLAEMGVFALRLAEDRGGLGRPAADATLVFEELGRALVPGPLVWTHAVAGLVDGASSGETVIAGANVQGTTSKTPIVVEHLADADALVVLRADSVERLDPRRVKYEALATPLDPLTPVARVAELPAGERIGGSNEARRVRLEATALVAAQLLGIAEATLALALDYAKVREQFGRAIGSFQAIKHILADMFVRLEIARAAVYAAGATLDAPDVGDPARAVSVAKLEAADAALLNAKACIQVHGGMGYTWEVPAHYFLKRAWALDSLLGTREDHADLLGREIVA